MIWIVKVSNLGQVLFFDTPNLSYKNWLLKPIFFIDVLSCVSTKIQICLLLCGCLLDGTKAFYHKVKYAFADCFFVVGH